MRDAASGEVLDLVDGVARDGGGREKSGGEELHFGGCEEKVGVLLRLREEL